MRMMIIGLGYVGSVVAAGLAHAGHHITGVDNDPQKIKAFLNNRANISFINEIAKVRVG